MQELRETTSRLVNNATGGGCLSRELPGEHRPRERWSVMSYGRRRGLRPVSPYAIVLALAIALTASFFLPLRAEAAISDHTVPTTSPSGTTINLFDYWVNPDNHLSVSGNGGINASHRFQFNDGQGDAPLNHWTGNTSPQPGIVSNTLSDGYPQLSGTYGGDSLRYLFDSSAQTGKTSHFGVTGLLKVQDGYYVYDSSENYAAYNADKNAFDVYNTWGIDKVGDSSHRGQFFPFDAADKVFKEESGRLVQNGITADNAGNHVNHHFGLSMSTRFVQPNGGLTNDKKDMTFEFAGDDDVWVFIDDVLVGDIGGIHSRASLSINFHTGDIKVNDKSDGTLLSKYQAAKKGTSGFDGNTFKDGTNHTLKFFYLERGATDSNMELKFNLVTVPESDIIKFDQDGDPVEGAQFALYKTDENFTDTTANQNNLLGSGTTNANGQLTLTNDVDNGVINFDDLYKEYHYQHYLLKETKAPNGYRSSLTATDGNMQLEYVPASDKKDAGGVIINRGGMDADSVVWKTGAFAAAKETITAPSTVYKANDNLTKSDKIDDLESGILFAVVLKRDKSANADIKDQNNWYAVSGDPSTGMGYTLAEKSSKAGAIEAAKKDLHAFTLNTSGQYQVEIQNLPGDISKYYYLLSGDARKDAEYTVAIYYTTASSIAEARMDNTVHVFSDDLPDGKENFRRQFATRLLVTNIQNRLFVQKTDSEGKPVDGAKFGLYKSTQVTEDANGKAVLNGEQTPYDTLTTRSVANPVKLEGAGIFPYTSDGKEPLVKGTYYLKEVSAPQGFLLNDTLTKVIVDDYGVHADAGTPDDGVSTFVGVGSLLKSLSQFGAEGDIDNTLTWIKGMRQTSDGGTDADGNLSWSDVDPAGAGDTVRLKYGANERVYQYGPTEKGKPYRLETETGWIRMGITQDVSGDTNAKGARANLDDMNLNALFTGATCVRVANEREASLEVTKKVDVPDDLTGNKDAEFTFKFTVPEGKTYKAAVFKNAGAGKQAGDVFDLKNGDTHAIKADETIRVYGLAKGDNYTVQELTGKDEMPAGYKLTGRKQGDKNLTEEGDSISGTIASQNSNGTLAEDNKLVFTNSYKTEASDKLTPQVTKKISGTERTDKKFSFTLAATSKTKDKIDAGDLEDDGLKGDTPSESKTTKGEITGKDGQTLNFSDMTFNKAGDYTFTLTEAHGEDDDPNTTGVQNAGWTMDDSTYTVTVKVEDKNAKLTVTGVAVEKDGDDKSETLEVKKGKVNLATFTNSYAAKGSVTLAAKKHFTGGALAGNDFSFALYKGDKAEGTPLETVTNDENGNITFQPINYTEAGDYDYTIKEVAGNDSTVVYDGKTVSVHVRVTDNKNGTLGATATYGGDKAVPTFTNAKPTAGATIEAKKTLTGKALTGGAFAFGLYDQAGNEVAKGTNDRGGNVKLAVENLNLGEYDYTLKEEKAGQTVDGVVYDAKKVKVHVKVEQNQDDNNKTKVTVTYDGTATAPTFNNTYDAKGSVTLTATKTIKVADGFDHTTKPTDGEFTFDLKDAAGNVLDTAKNDANGKVSFTREFQLSDLDGTASKDFTYTIVEQPGAEPGMVYDTHALTYTVKVTDGGNGALNAKAIVTSASGPETFTNTYQPAATGLALGAQKSYVKKDDNTPIVLKGGEFTFDVYEGNLTAEQLAEANPVRTATNDTNGSVGFDAFSYAKPGTHEYTIVERKGDLAYVTYDAAVHHAVVTVADNAGTLQASVAYDGADATKPTFTNTYKAKATNSGAIALTKSVDVHDGSYQLKAGDFAFELVGSDGTVLQTQKNDAKGKVYFNELTFDHAGTFPFTVREVQPTDGAPGVPGVTYTGKTYTLTYVVKDNNDGKLVVESSTVKPSEGTENGVTPNTMTFANSYQPGQTSYQISGTKVLENADPATTRTPADGEFTFALIDVATGQEIDRTTNVGKAFTFKAISYTATGSHAYQVKEVAGQDGTITYSDAVLDVTVNVTDDGSGQLTATANKTAADLTFTNTYTPTATTATITGTKALTGRDLAEGEFFFDLKDADGNVVQTVQNGADGTFGFAPLQLDKVGTYVYTVSERAGATANGVTYDTTVFTATVTVTENVETHALEAQVAYSKGGKAADAVAFSNSYAPAATEVKLGASKVLSGEDLKEGQFSFQLKDADGKVLQTAKNAADGTVGFEAISYDKPGTYAYSISEVDDGQKNVTYDAAEHRVTVTVTDDGAGHLVATVTYDGAVAPVFKNTYTPPTTPPTEPPTNPPSKSPVPKEEKPGLPYTGDTSLSPMALGGIAGGAVVLIAAGVILRRRNR